MSRCLLAFLALACAVTLRAQGNAALRGRVEGTTYYSPTGAFKVAVPVLPELGGDITDTPNVVTFRDDFNTHVSIAIFPQDATQRWELSTRGTKDYLVYFFTNFILADFRRNFQGVEAEQVTYAPSELDGALIAYMLIPGGSMFMDRIARLGLTQVPVAKRGNMVFVKNGDIYVISTELAERVLEGKSYKKTPAEENKILRQRLDDIVAKMQFLKTANTKAGAAMTPTPPAPTSK